MYFWLVLTWGFMFGWIVARVDWRDVWTHEGWCDECFSAPNDCDEFCINHNREGNQ
jgi:hypothetical protein